MRCVLPAVAVIAGCGITAPPAPAAAVKPLALGVADHRVLFPAKVLEADAVWSSTGDLALTWSSGNTLRVVTRAAGGPFRGPVVLPGAHEAKADQSLEGPVVGAGGGTVISWRNGTGTSGLGLLQLAIADPGGAIAPATPLATLPAIGEPPRNSTRTAVGPDGGATMAVARPGVLVSERPPRGSFGPELPVSSPGEIVDYSSVVMTRDDAGGVTVTWQSKLPCVTVAAPQCHVNRVATRPPGGTFGVPRSLAELSTGPSGLRGSDPKRLSRADHAADGAGRTVLAWQRIDPGRFDGMEASVGSAGRGYGPPVTLPGTSHDAPVPGARCPPAPVRHDPGGTNYLFGALPASDGREVVVLRRVNGCGTDVETFTLYANGTVGAGRVVVSGIGSRAPGLVRRGAHAALIVYSRGRVRAALVRDGAFGRLLRIGPRVVRRPGPAALMRDGSLVAEVGRSCPGGADSTIAHMTSRSKVPVTRRVGPCGTPAPTLIDGDGALVTLTLRNTLEGEVSCPLPAALAAQRAHRRPRCR